jgi:ubiquinone/menaquinone biosynthesis C-methylase UbiE
MKEYWSIRAKKYNQLNWVKSNVLMEELINFCNFNKSNKVLDAGCGTGVVSKEIINLVSTVYAVDKSEDMLCQMKDHTCLVKMCKDIETEIIAEKFFDKIIARMVFHHINNLPQTFSNCYEMLKPKGWLIVQEGGVIPSGEKEVFEWYSKMIALKENRHNFTLEELKEYFFSNKFKNITTKIVIDRNFSINNWLQNSGQDKKILKKIYDLHYNAPERVKKYYNMKIKGKEIIINSKVLIIKGQK